MIEVAERQPGALLAVTAWPETAHVVAKLLAELSATRLPLAPGRWLLERDERSVPLEVASETAVVTDLTHARIVLRLSGDGVAVALQKYIGFDLNLRRFPPGASASTAIRGIAVLVHRLADEVFDIYVPSSFGAAFREWLARIS